MGSLTYGSSVYEIEDRMLQHLKAVVATKLRRHESFTLAWNVEAAYGSGRVALWMHAGVPLVFTFAGSRVPPLNPVWVEAMMTLAASSQTGLS
ncbi:DUF7882 family protein, partial [Burkholderia cenocepacia]|uniref:DUF7882 family protein n=1 Tax=Burkholderia cenocepacia TaxID=95486 RepID=UPI0038CC0064